MADEAAVKFILQVLKELIVSTIKKISELDNEVKRLRNNLNMFRGFLQDYTNEPTKSESLKALVTQIRRTVYEGEAIIDEYAIEADRYKSSTVCEKIKNPLRHPTKLLDLAHSIKPMMAMVSDLNEEKEKEKQKQKSGDKERKDGDGSNTAKISKVPIVEEDHVVGFDDDAKKVINLLTRESDELEVVSIVGMPGLGKTTLAKMIFRDPAVYEFDKRAWAHISRDYISQDCNKKEVFLAILDQITDVTDDIRNMTEDRLARKLKRSLEEAKYLIVLDDVWTQSDWNHLQNVFPKNKKKCRILLTSRDKNVGKNDNCKLEYYHLRILDPDESWTLLKRKAFGLEECPQELIKHGRQIAVECGGLPFAIAVIGGILQEKGPESYHWEVISKNVKDYIVEMDQRKITDSFIEWIFNQLPYDLKAVFIYFGVLPEGYRISARKLIRLWIAEEFVQRKGGIHLENTAEDYLECLVNRNLVIVEKWRTDGRIKTCYVHGMIHAFCKKKAVDEIFYHEIKRSDQITDSSSNGDFKMYRGLSIPPNILNNISPEQFGSYVRSFLCFSNDEITSKIASISSFPKTFKLLCVLDGEPIRFTRFPANLVLLVNLRYLFLSIQFDSLPKYVTNLWNMQTLIVKTSKSALEIKGDIVKMVRLRHLETNVSTSFPDPFSRKRNNKKGSLINLRTLSTISPETCSKDVVERVPNLSELGVRGQLSKLFEVKGGSSLFDNVKQLNCLENLKLFNHVVDAQDTKSKIVSPPVKFPSNLKKLTLYGTQLDWMYMSTLGMLEKLEVLKLKENAFKGKHWCTGDGGFRALKILYIGKTDLVNWEASGTHFPNLKSLHLKQCTYLSTVPFGLADISTLWTIELYETNDKAATSAKKIRTNKEDPQTNQGKEFKLSIYPPDHDK
ncbi:putative late blight resistance protein homolog R1A-3 [Olea europaea var. sylvestris]|uniref:putative late blight resistance protein homolog R1A-3 n=1 Tax=Olea europaea var. sylvestris TaxID=158386 RepID=UPI000C1CFF58|nr:putative late blight resistance protein homolog R1A-3 [Olea europaea var. sylvestris]XP_022887345.1 putative late blight resistance protein homolog R1A-3 [Olea europaea var. sylvestris]